MRKKVKTKYEFVRGQYEGLESIAREVNLIAEVKGSERELWGQIELILTEMTDQPRAKKVPALRFDWFGLEWSPNDRYPWPAFAIQTFNDLAKKNPVTLGVTGRKISSKLEVIPDQQKPTTTSWVLLLLWEYYFKGDGWKRIKRCPICEKWFVDETTNRTKIRCSEHCTAVWWNRSRRKEAGHKIRKPVVRKKQGKRQKRL
jgi:hypothetical protein